MKTKIAAIILAAGKGERMKSELPKVLHRVCGRPMLGYVLDLVKDLKASDSIVVLGYKHEEVRKFLPSGLKSAIQKKILGTGDAVKQALPFLREFKGTIVVLYGDNPLLKPETIKKMVSHHLENQAAATLLVAKLEDPSGYGRILRDKYGSLCGIAEDKDADDFQKSIKEINTGILCFAKDKLIESLKAVKPNNAKKEYYLTDVIDILYKKGEIVETLELKDPNEALGINSRVELAQANKIMQRRINEGYMKEGVTIVSPETAFISFGTVIGRDTTIYPFTVIENDVKIGGQCFIGPFAHLRPKTELQDNVAVGNFIEISRSKLSAKSRAKHFGFIGDANIGQSVNIGAGTVTANYDGKSKNKTIIKDHAFIGSDTVLVAPLCIGRGAKTGAGSVVTRGRNVPDHTVVVGVPARQLKR
jgi:bifunctional UDP-N-acetylglucosamine pyrophosphorylase / glucosamine-1-phosphate N-acetyltransferase